jgi:hypothetical protein
MWTIQTLGSLLAERPYHDRTAVCLLDWDHMVVAEILRRRKDIACGSRPGKTTFIDDECPERVLTPNHSSIVLMSCTTSKDPTNSPDGLHLSSW